MGPNKIIEIFHKNIKNNKQLLHKNYFKKESRYFDANSRKYKYLLCSLQRKDIFAKNNFFKVYKRSGYF